MEKPANKADRDIYQRKNENDVPIGEKMRRGY